jgi:hypothetical protein
MGHCSTALAVPLLGDKAKFGLALRENVSEHFTPKKE